jgi:hypothetical protein
MAERIPIEMPSGGELKIGNHGVVTWDVEVIPQASLEMYYAGWMTNIKSAGLCIDYHGHKEDLAEAGCLPAAGLRYDRFCDDGHGGAWWLTSKAGPGKRGIIRISYYTCNRVFARSLPGVSNIDKRVLLQLTTPPRLRLIVDNTREVGHG